MSAGYTEWRGRANVSTLWQQYSGLLQAALLAAACFAFVISLASAAAFHLTRPYLLTLQPGRRAKLLLGWTALPVAGVLAFLTLIFMPTLLGLTGLLADHCHLHPDHPHLCFVHPPQLDGGAMLIAVLVVLVVAIAIGVTAWVVECWRTARAVGVLANLSEHEETLDMHVVATDAPLAFVAGLGSPRLFVSRHLIAHLTEAQLTIVIAHERAHARRRDALCQLIASVLSRLHLPTCRRQLLADLALAAEQACDEHAVAQSGDRLAVAEAIISVEKLFARWQHNPGLLAVSHFNGSNVAQRVQSLLVDAHRKLTR